MTDMRHFSINQVNDLVPRLDVAARLMCRGSKVMDKLSKKLFKGSVPEGDTLVDSGYMAGVDVLMKGMQAIGEMGGEIKDLKTGLVDFRSLHQGREVLLCWRLGEERVGFWHELDSGFANRSAIASEDEFRGDAEPA